MINHLDTNEGKTKKHSSRIKYTESMDLLKSAHVLYTYTDKKMYLDNLVIFITTGIELRQSVFVIESDDIINNIMKQLLASEQLLVLQNVTFIESTNHYVSKDKIDKGKALKNLKTITDPLKKRNVPIRIWGSIHGVELNKNLKVLYEYESEADLLLAQMKALTVCAYDATLISGAVLIQIMKNHEYLMTDKELYSCSLFSKNAKENSISIAKTIDESLLNYKKNKDEIIRLERFNMVSQMAATISHEVRNPLTTTRGFLQLFMKKEEYKQDWNFFSIMIAELDRANAILTEFLALSQDKPSKFELQCLNSIIESVTPLVNAIAMETEKSLEVDLNDIPLIAADEDEIRQVLFNLLKNGLDAMSPGGVISVTTFQEHGDVFLEITDQGNGISEEIMDNIGSPFISTKQYGTGLGLATTYSILERHKARVDLITGPNGTTFLIRFKSFNNTTKNCSSKSI